MRLLYSTMTISFNTQITSCRHHDVGQLSSVRLLYQRKCPG